MRNLFLSLACMLFATSVWAQTETAVPQPQEKKKSIAGFETNGFWDNWEISASAGAGSAFTVATTRDPTETGSVSPRVSP